MKILLVYPPFCTPASPPYSITGLHSFLCANLSVENIVGTMDLNLDYHLNQFADYQKYYSQIKKSNLDLLEYSEKTKEFISKTKKEYSENNKKILNGNKPKLFNKLFDKIKKTKADFVAFSVVYSSQVFYTYSLILELNKSGIKTIIGGPAVSPQLKKISKYLKDKHELLKFISPKSKLKQNHTVLDFTQYSLQKYFVPCSVIPIKTSSTCYYQQCTFCTHHNKKKYLEFPLEKIEKTIQKSKQKYFFFIDDMIHKKRLLEIAKIMKTKKANWTCQLKPTKELDLETFKILYDSGLKMIIWGVESGSNKILKLMKKGTNQKEVGEVLANAHSAGIKNVLYIMFGFPGETKKEFLETIDFLTSNTNSIDLVSTSIFGLQKETPIFKTPSFYGIKKIKESKRTLLDSKISYLINSGLSQKEASQLRQKYKKTINKINKYSKTMNFFREHMLCILE